MLLIVRFSSANIIFGRAAMRSDESARVEPALGFLPIPRPDEWRNELAHFKMQMGEIAAVRSTNRCDLLAAMDLVAG